jgi:hypothetical protein
MRVEIKTEWGDKIALRDGSVGVVAEQDKNAPYVIRAAFKNKFTGALVTRYVRAEEVEQVMPRQ